MEGFDSILASEYVNVFGVGGIQKEADVEILGIHLGGTVIAPLIFIPILFWSIGFDLL